MTSVNSQEQATPLNIIAHVSRLVTQITDRITGDRADYPLLVAGACRYALNELNLGAQVIYGQAAWIEVLNNHEIVWAGCWGQNFHFWVSSESGEVIDLITSVAYRKKAHDRQESQPLYSPPMVWSREVPRFYRYEPEGVAEIEPTQKRDQKWWEVVQKELSEKCSSEKINPDGEPNPQDFPNEPIICPGRKLLDDSQKSFQHYDRMISVKGIPPSPF